MRHLGKIPKKSFFFLDSVPYATDAIGPPHLLNSPLVRAYPCCPDINIWLLNLQTVAIFEKLQTVAICEQFQTVAICENLPTVAI